MKNNNYKSILRIEHKDQQNLWLEKTYGANCPIRAGLYTFFSEYDPYSFNGFRENEIIKNNEKLAAIKTRLDNLEKVWSNPREGMLRDSLYEKGKKQTLDENRCSIRVPASWNYKRVNAFCDPFLRETWERYARDLHKLPLYGFENKEAIISWFDGDTDFIKQIFDSEHFVLVRYRAKNVFHGLRQSIFYPHEFSRCLTTMEF